MKVKINAIFHNDRKPKEGSHFIFLSVTLTGFILKLSKNYYLYNF